MSKARSQPGAKARVIGRVVACVSAATLILSLAGGWTFHTIETGSLPMLRTTLRPVHAQEVMPLGYVYRAGSGPFVRAQLLRRHTGLEPRVVLESPWCGTCAQRTITELAFYEGRSTDAVGTVINAAAGRGVESFAVTEIGWPLPLWRSTVELPTVGVLQTGGIIRIGPVWLAARPVWPGFLLWATLLATSLSACWRALGVVRSRGDADERCRVCRYDLAGLRDQSCPECGTTHRTALPSHASDRHARRPDRCNP